MPGLRRIILALAAVTLLLPQVAAAEPAETATDVCTLPSEERPEVLAEPVQLCGVTTISGEQSGRIRLHIPHDISLEFPMTDFVRPVYDETSPIQISGAGRVRGIALVEESYSEEHPGLPTGSATLFYTVPGAPIASTEIDEVANRMKLTQWLRLSVSASLLMTLAAPDAVVAAQSGGSAVGGLTPVATVPYTQGTHLEHATIDERDYLFAATQTSTGAIAELRVIDVTDPTAPVVKATMKCGNFQGNLQVSADQKTLILGVDRVAPAGKCGSQEGFVTIDITDPTRPRPVGFAAIPGGSHSTAAHPTLPLVYNAPDGDPLPSRDTPELEVWSIADPSNPKLVNTVGFTGTHSPHDISFNPDGTLAASANITTFTLWDTHDATNPKELTTSQCPACHHSHEARFTPDSKRLIVNDESVAPSTPCPGGGLYFYDITGTGDARDVSLHGSYVIDDAATAKPGFCTPHVFDLSSDGTKVAASWHFGGVRLLDITKSAGVTIGTQQRVGEGVREIGSYNTTSGDFFTAKLHNGPYIYAVDNKSGLVVLHAPGLE